MARSIAEHNAPVVVELGPGTGAFTTEIQRQLGGRGHHIAVEVNERFAALLHDRFPDVDVAVDRAEETPNLLAARGLAAADVIVSGLPWAAYPRQTQLEILGSICDSLTAEGTFVTFAYLHAAWAPPARRFRALLEESFGEVIVGRTVWANLPPAFAYTARWVRR
ncbi:class I SAM-dependent methyltransferase [Phytoactinopolyspora limicola]|uniref:class I SAM-dependent methyltransferase n=1 Tax=Phytoactinopolyspora limicola TaxID=2715536 RepID=UPI001A9C7A1F|nr:hypothetical protein [Phytoactinopolyspora limicola]